MDPATQRKILVNVAKGVIPMALMGIFGLLAGSSGFMQVWVGFNWLFAIRTFFVGGAVVATLVTFICMVMLAEPPRDPRAWKTLGISVPMAIVLWTVYAGLWAP